MSPAVTVSNESGVPVCEAGVVALVEGVLAREGVCGALTVAFVSEEVIADLNQRYRGVSDPTDVLSFPTGDDDDWPDVDTDGDGGDYLGDVLVCPALARANAHEDGIAPGEELRRLIVHGVLHLLGWDHETDRGEMRGRESTLLEELPFRPEDLLAEG